MGILLSSFIEKPKKTTYEGEDTDENIIYIFRRSFITNLGWITTGIFMFFIPFFVDFIFATSAVQELPTVSTKLIVVLNAFWYLVTFGFLFQNFLNWFFNVYIITNKKIIDVDFHGLLSKNISEAALRNVEDVTSNVTGALKVIFNYGHVFVQTSAEKREFDFEDVSNPSKVRDLISDLAMEVKNG